MISVLGTFRACLGLAFVVVFTATYGIVYLLMSLLNPSSRLTDFVLHSWCAIVLRTFGVRVMTEGQENLPAGGCLFVFNHSSLFDIPAFYAAHNKSARFGAKIELFRIPIFGAVMRRSGVLPIARHDREGVLRLYQESIERVRAGESFVLAGEGTRQTQPGVGEKFKAGPFVFAITGQFPIVPIVMKGAYEVLPKSRILPNHDAWVRPIRVKILPPVSTQGLTLEDRPALQEKVRQRMAQEFRAMAMGIAFVFASHIFAGPGALMPAAHASDQPSERASERLGELHWSEIFLEPRLLMGEGEKRGFDLGDSRFSWRWSQPTVSVQAALGPQGLLGRPGFYSPLGNTKEWTVVEAFGTYESPYFEVRAGLLPIEWGFSGRAESALALPHPRQFTLGLIGRRDYGVSWHTSYKGFFTRLLVHQGMAVISSGGPLWVLGQWGWTDRHSFAVRVTAQTGRSGASDTDLSNFKMVGFLADKDAKWRQGELALKHQSRRWGLEGAVGAGALEQDGRVQGDWWLARAEATFRFHQNLQAATRVERWQMTSSDINYLIGYDFSLQYQTDDGTSALRAVARQTEGGELGNEYFLAWRLRSSYF